MRIYILTQHWILLGIALLLALGGPQVAIYLGYSILVVVMQLTAVGITILTAANVVLRTFRIEREATARMIHETLDSYNTVLGRYSEQIKKYEEQRSPK